MLKHEDVKQTNKISLAILETNHRALRTEIEEETFAIGGRVRAIHKRSTDTSPFQRHKTIMERIKRLSALEHAYNANRMRLKTRGARC